jgi:hypothetical protein
LGSRIKIEEQTMKINLNWANTGQNNRKVGLQFSMLNTGQKPYEGKHTAQLEALSGAIVKVDPRYFQR